MLRYATRAFRTALDMRLQRDGLIDVVCGLILLVSEMVANGQQAEVRARDLLEGVLKHDLASLRICRLYTGWTRL